MSRIGKQPVPVPAKVKVAIQGNRLSAEGPKGKLEMTLPSQTQAVVDGAQVKVTRSGESAEAKSMHGLARALINNLLKGVSEGFQKKLAAKGCEPFTSSPAAFAALIAEDLPERLPAVLRGLRENPSGWPIDGVEGV